MESIFETIIRNDVPAFMGLVEERESWLEERSMDQNSNTVLHMAAKHGHEELVSTIIALRPSLLNSRNANGDTPLHLAALIGDVNIVNTLLNYGWKTCSARNKNNQTPLHLACGSMSFEAARLIAEETNSVGLDELNFAISSGSTYIAGIIMERFPHLAREEAWEVEGGSQSTLLHHACDREDLELTSILLGLDQRLEKTFNADGLSPLHLAVLRGSTLIIEEFLEKAPSSFDSLTPSKESVFHLAARSKNIYAFITMADSVCINSQTVMQQTDQNGNTVLHIAASMVCSDPKKLLLIRYIVCKKIVDINYKNKMGFTACDLLPQKAENFKLLSTWLRIDTELDSNQNSEVHNGGHSNPYHKRSLERVESLGSSGSSTKPDSNHNEVNDSRRSNSFHKHSLELIKSFDSSGSSTKLNNEVHNGGHSNPYHKRSLERVESLGSSGSSTKLDSDHNEVNDSRRSNSFHKQSLELIKSFDSSGSSTKLNNEVPVGRHSNPFRKQSMDRVTPLDISVSSKENEMIRLLRLIETSTSKTAEIKRTKKKVRPSLESEMDIEALQNARNTIAIVAVLIASVAYAGGINPPGGVYQEGAFKGKSLVGKTTAFKVFAICNNVALFTALCIVILLVSIIPYKRKPLKGLLVATHRMMWVSVGFMATAYVAASWVTIPHYDGTRWLFPAIISVAGGSLMVLFSYLGVETIGHWFKKMNRVGDLPVYIIRKKRGGDILAASGVNKSKGSMPSLASINSDFAASGKSGYFTY